jgi:hypothetical protein
LRGPQEAPGSGRKQVHEFVDGRRLQPLLVTAQRQYGLLLLGGEAAREIGPEFRLEQRYAFLAAAAVADRVFDRGPAGLRARPEEYLDRVGDRALCAGSR